MLMFTTATNYNSLQPQHKNHFGQDRKAISCLQTKPPTLLFRCNGVVNIIRHRLIYSSRKYLQTIKSRTISTHPCSYCIKYPKRNIQGNHFIGFTEVACGFTITIVSIFTVLNILVVNTALFPTFQDLFSSLYFNLSL